MTSSSTNELEPGRTGSASRQWPAFDGVRALAALAILLFHAAAVTGDIYSGSASNYLSQLDLAVPVFFVLSGFLLYRPFAAAHLRDEPSPSVRRYALRRLVRILPAYWLALTFAVYVFHDAHIANAGDFVVFYGLLQIYDGAHVFGGLVQAWSLCTEISFYAFLPLYAIAVGARRSRAGQATREWLGLALLYAVSVIFRLWLLSVRPSVGYAFLPAYADVFALGMGLAVASVMVERNPDYRRHVAIRTLSASPALAWTAAAILFWIVSNLGLPHGLQPLTTSQYMTRQFLAGLIAVLLVGSLVFADGRSLLGRALATRSMRWLGAISFGIFLWHRLWLTELAAHQSVLPDLVDLVPIALAGVVVTASISYVLLERPLLRASARIGS